MIYRINYGGKDFKDFNVFFDGSKVFDKPSRDVENISVVGRNGDLIISNKRFNNIDITIPCFIKHNFIENYSALMDYLTYLEGYQKLETTEEPNTYRLAQFKDSTEPKTGAFMKYGSFDLVFNCKPQIFLNEGDQDLLISSGNTLLNPTLKEAKPLIKVRGTGSITINDRTLALNQNTGQTFIDCDIQDAYQGTINRNSNLTVTSEFPVLKVGQNVVAYSGFSEVIIVPRWWKI